MTKKTKKTAITTELAPKADSKEMVLNAQVKMEDIISIFASKYEEGLYKAAEMARTGIRNLRQDLVEMEQKIKDSVDVSKLLAKHPLFASVEETTRKVGREVVTVDFALLNKKGARLTTISHGFEIGKKLINEREKQQRKLSEVEGELAETLQKIRDIGRKERQIRARIVERKLEQSGLSDLLQDTEMQNLIALD